MTEARIKRPEAEGAFFSMAKISFRNTSGLTKVPMSSAALTHCKKERGEDAEFWKHGHSQGFHW